VSTKTAQFEVKKMGTKVRKKRKQNIFCSYFFFFEASKTHLALETNSTKL